MKKLIVLALFAGAIAAAAAYFRSNDSLDLLEMFGSGQSDSRDHQD